MRCVAKTFTVGMKVRDPGGCGNRYLTCVVLLAEARAAEHASECDTEILVHRGILGMRSKGQTLWV